MSVFHRQNTPKKLARAKLEPKGEMARAILGIL